MPSLTIVVANPGDADFRGTGPHRKVTITSAFGTTTLTVTSPEVSHTGLARRWTEVPRPGQSQPFLRYAGGQLRKWKIAATLYADPPADVAADLELLMFNHTRSTGIAVAYGRLEAHAAIITDLTVKTVQRVEGSNEPYWADIEIEFTQQPDDIRQVAPIPAPSAAPAPTPTPPTPAQRTYTVKAGDTLSAIAQRQYGHADYWPRIAEANKIADPRRIYPGQRLTIP